MFSLSLILFAFLLFQFIDEVAVRAFCPYRLNLGSASDIYNYATHVRLSGLFSTTDLQVEDFDDWSNERKSSLFQFLLRDLEVEGVPLLGCDGVSANKTLQGSIWTVAGQMSENNYDGKVCLIYEDIPVYNLKQFVDFFGEIKKQKGLMGSLHDFERFSLNLVGNGIGPALILETRNRTEAEIMQYDSMKNERIMPNEPQWRAAIESFVKRSFPELEGDSIAYRFLGSSDVCDILSGYWNCICELEATDSSKANSMILLCPPTSGEEALSRFAAVSEIINTMNSIYEKEYKYDLVHIHPSYDSEKIQSQNESTNGHLPRTDSLRQMLLENSESGRTELLTDEQLKLQNYQRRSPLPGVIINRSSKKKENKSGRIDYQNIIRLAQGGEEKLKEAVMVEKKLVFENEEF